MTSVEPESERFKRPFNWGLLVLGDPAAEAVPELSRGQAIGHSFELIVVAVRHAQDIEDAEGTPFEVEINCRQRSAGFSDSGYHALIRLPSGGMSIGDAEHESVVRLGPGWWWVSITLSPPVHAEKVDIEFSRAETCPVCLWPGLMEEAWSQDCPSHEICPSCGTEFGYDDAVGFTDVEALTRRHDELRQAWVSAGMRWWSDSSERPEAWHPGG